MAVDRLPITAPLLLAAGRLNVQKNLHSLLRLLAAVRREVPQAHLCFVGEEDDIGLHEFGVLNTGYVEWLRGQATALGLAEAVTFTGPVFGEDLAQLYAAADVLVSASIYHRENFGLAPAEAQACGVPVVCSAWNGFKDVVRDGKTGFLMDVVLTRHGMGVDWATGASAARWSGASCVAWTASRQWMALPPLSTRKCRTLTVRRFSACCGNCTARAFCCFENRARGNQSGRRCLPTTVRSECDFA